MAGFVRYRILWRVSVACNEIHRIGSYVPDFEPLAEPLPGDDAPFSSIIQGFWGEVKNDEAGTG